MRISDWSSDVCSSDLDDRSGRKSIMALMSIAHRCPTGPSRQETPMTTYESAFPTAAFARAVRRAGPRHAALYRYAALNLPAAVLVAVAWRSEEHTSELQSLMRISYAVFCLKKKKKLQQTNA